jgi:hypothetical protein
MKVKTNVKAGQSRNVNITQQGDGNTQNNAVTLL